MTSATPPDAPAEAANPCAGLEDIVVHLAELPSPIGWRSLFGRDAPIEVEIGSGNGIFLSLRARACPEATLLGLEPVGEWFVKAAKRLRRDGVANARLLRAGAEEVFRYYTPPATVRTVHIYFPDPWPKKRHHKRRLIQPAFLADLARALAPGGTVQLATDHAGYGRWILEAFAAAPSFVPCDAFPPLREEGQSNFESKYLREGRPIRRFAYAKT